MRNHDRSGDDPQGPRRAKLHTARRALRPIAPGGLAALVGAVLAALSSFAPYRKVATPRGGVEDACQGLKGKFSYKACLELTAGHRDRAANTGWDAWHSSVAWVSILLLLVVAGIFIAKLLGYHPRKRRLESTALILVIVSDVLFFWVFSATKDAETTRAWGIYLALILLIIVNIGALLAFVNVDGIMAARARDREKRTTPADPYDKGHYPVGQSPRYDTPEPPPPGGYPPPPS